MHYTPLNFDRRTFLRSAFSAATLFSLGTSCASPPAANDSGNPLPCPPAGWRKHGIVLEGTEPWEGDNLQRFTSRPEPLANGRWRIWYSLSTRKESYNIACAEGIPGQAMQKIPAVSSPGDPADAPMAIGNLPHNWKPVQPVHLKLPDGRHRLYFWAHAPEICRYLAAESLDGRRYRVLDPLRPLLYHPSDRAAAGVPSPDGVMYRKEKALGRPAGEPLALPHLISKDATNVYLLPDGSFELYTVALIQVPRTDPAYIPEDNAPGRLRVIDRFTSPDGLRLENRRRVIQRDAKDPADQQFYYLSVTHTPEGRVGMLGHYRCAAQTMDLEWCFSRDGLLWDRPRRQAWIPRGTPPAPDCYGIYAPSQLVHHAGRWHLFYTGVNSAHNIKHSHGKPRQVIMWATTESVWA